MPNIRGIKGYVGPGAFSETVTLARSVSLPGGPRITCIIGLGARNETIVASAAGSGADGEPADFSTDDPDGRHFLLNFYPIVSNRTSLFKNGSELIGTEDEVINSGTFTPGIDYRINITNGRIELKNASLVDQDDTVLGTQYWRYVTGITNIGSAVPTAITLRDENAPAERWTLKCIDIGQDGYGNTIPGAATFSVTGTVSGSIRSSETSQPIFWRSDGTPTTTSGARLVVNSNRIAITDATFDLSDLLLYEKYTLVVVTDALTQNGTYLLETIDLDGFDLSSEQSVLVTNLDGTTPSFTADAIVSLEMITSNGVISFDLDDTTAVTPFAIGDRFVIEVESGVLQARDSLTAEYIATSDVNDPEFFVDAEKLYEKHGRPTEDNTLALGAQLAFSNNIPGIMALQAKPPLPRKVTETVLAADDLTTSAVEGASGGATLADLTFDITWPGQPDKDTQVLIFILSTDGTETQIFPSKFGFYNSTVEADQGEEFSGVVVGTGTKTNSYTIINEDVDLGDGFEREEARLIITKDLALTAGEGLKIKYIDEKDADYFDATWTAALTTIESQDPYFIVPLPNVAFSSIFQAVLSHVETMSSVAWRRERMMLIGAIAGVTIDALLGRELVAAEDIGIIEGIQGDDPEEVLSGDIEDLQDYSIATNWGGSYRCVYFYPDEIITTVSGQNTVIQGFYLAAAASGWLSAQQNVSIPLTRKNLAGFTITRDNLPTPSQQDELGGAGVCLVTPILGGGKVRHGLTTVQSGSPEEEEISIVSIRDTVAQTLRTVLENRFVGTVESATTAASITNVTSLTLNAFISQGLVTEYAGLNVGRDDVEPRQWNVSVAIQPAYPINWIWISVSVGVL